MEEFNWTSSTWVWTLNAGADTPLLWALQEDLRGYGLGHDHDRNIIGIFKVHWNDKATGKKLYGPYFRKQPELIC